MLVYLWKHRRFTNFGDELNKSLVSAVWGKDCQITRNACDTPKLLAIGSVLSTNHARQGDTVWGSGMLKATALPKLNIKAVRGPKTYMALKKTGQQVPEIFGDPALLLPKYFPHIIGGRCTGYIPHFDDHWSLDGCLIIDVKSDPFKIITAIVRCDLIVSGSLHGIIVAEAYGIPAVLADSNEIKNKGMFKYEDYYESTGRTAPSPVPYANASISDWPGPPILPDLDALISALPSPQ